MKEIKMRPDQIELIIGILDSVRIDAILEENNLDQDELLEIIEILEKIK
jgi:hypothetical protein